VHQLRLARGAHRPAHQALRDLRHSQRPPGGRQIAEGRLAPRAVPCGRARPLAWTGRSSSLVRRSPGRAAAPTAGRSGTSGVSARAMIHANRGVRQVSRRRSARTTPQWRGCAGRCFTLPGSGIPLSLAATSLAATPARRSTQRHSLYPRWRRSEEPTQSVIGSALGTRVAANDGLGSQPVPLVHGTAGSARLGR
jgi:hypothetical protein